MQPSGERFGHIVDFVPRASREEPETARRKGNPAGTLILEEQERGLEIIAAGLGEVGSVEEAVDWAGCMALAGVGTSPYLFNGAVMNRHVALPMLATEDPSQRPSSEQLVEKTRQAFLTARDFAGSLTAAHTLRIGGEKKEQLRLKTGRAIAYASFLMATIELGDVVADPTSALSNHGVQMMVRDACMQTVQQAGTVSLEIGAFPSAAQLADPLSPLAVEIQRAGSDSVDRIYRQLV